ncbi:hypothetical protein D8849_09845 [Streptococcus mitis]|uniref:Uncharacterized protein n=1 Tax=Streptococcus mitis TaxID=28037 RepID=A0A428CZ24_STRMT|nr:hypothetical protein D8849_09845 [Streptococcus mitis]
MHPKKDVGCTCNCRFTSSIGYLIILQDTLQAISSIEIELIAHNQIDLLMKGCDSFSISHFLWRWEDLVLFIEIVCALAGSCNTIFASWFTCSELICQFNCSITCLLDFWSFRCSWLTRFRDFFIILSSTHSFRRLCFILWNSRCFSWFKIICRIGRANRSCSFSISNCRASFLPRIFFCFLQNCCKFIR